MVIFLLYTSACAHTHILSTGWQAPEFVIMLYALLEIVISQTVSHAVLIYDHISTETLLVINTG